MAARSLLALALLLALDGAARACAACGCGDQTLTATGVEKPYRNRIRIAVDERVGNFSVGDQNSGDYESGWTLRSAIAGSWSPHDRVTLGLYLPWVSSWIKQNGGPQKTLNGLGDLEMSLRVVMYRERKFAPHHLLWGLAGLKTPTGYRVYQDNGYPWPDDDQPGSGSWDPFFGATYGWFGDRVALFASASYRVTTPNTRDYRRGSTLGGSTAVQYQPFAWAAGSLGFDAGWVQPDTLPNGHAVPNTGGVLLDLVPSLMFMPVMDFLIKLSAQVPLVHVLNGTQTRGPQVILSLAYDIK
jgi:hypothetical protein